jgi:predicted branched-subunit amino acid permease
LARSTSSDCPRHWVYGGSFEALLGMVTAAATLASIAMAAFLAQARHVIHALPFPLHRAGGGLAKTYSTFAPTDEAYALTSTEQARNRSSPRILCWTSR